MFHVSHLVKKGVCGDVKVDGIAQQRHSPVASHRTPVFRLCPVSGAASSVDVWLLLFCFFGDTVVDDDGDGAIDGYRARCFLAAVSGSVVGIVGMGGVAGCVVDGSGSE